MFDDLIKTKFATEEDFRLAIINALLRTPHRTVGPFIPLFNYVHERDPLFFGRLAVWYFHNGTVHDLKQLFIALMATSKFSDEYRECGLAMLEKLPPFQVERVIGLVKGHTEGSKFIEGVAPSVPRSMRTAVEHYLRDREKNHEAFDNVVLHARRPLKTLYASLRIKPGEYAQRVLFDNDPPPESRLFVLKQLARSEDPTEQARLIVEHKIPYRVAISCLKNVTPSVLVALVNAMTPQELINNLSSLQKRGAMDNPDLRKMVEAKLEAAKTDARVSALKTREAMKAANLDSEMVEKVEAVGDVQIKSKARIKRPTAIHIDKSGSMEVAIEVGKQIAAIIAPICEANLYVYAFDSMPYPIEPKGIELSDWEKAFKGITAAGFTACGAGVEMMRKRKQVVEQILIVTDQQENYQPRLAWALEEYEKELGVAPSVVIMNVGRATKHLQESLQDAGVQVDTFDFKGDYYSLPSILPMLAGGTRAEFLMEVMSVSLMQRKARQLATV